MQKRHLVFLVGLIVTACRSAQAPAPGGPLRLVAVQEKPLPVAVTRQDDQRPLSLVSGELRVLGADTLIVSGEFADGETLTRRSWRSDTLHRSRATQGTFVSELPGMHRDMPVVVPWHLRWDEKTLVISSNAAGELLGMSGPFRFSPQR